MVQTTKILYHIVDAAGADIFSGKISNESPIAQALIGKKVGDKVAIESPAGSLLVEILSVEKQPKRLLELRCSIFETSGSGDKTVVLSHPFGCWRYQELG